MARDENSVAEKNLLAVDVGNTTTRLGLFARGELAGTWELTTHERLTVDEARMQLAQAAALMGEALPEEAILACVVPTLTDVWRRALAAACGCKPLVVGPGLKTGLKMRYDDPSEVGADRVADVRAAREDYGAPVVVVDLGTTTNFEVVDAEGAFVGGIIAPVWPWVRARSLPRRRACPYDRAARAGLSDRAQHARGDAVRRGARGGRTHRRPARRRDGRAGESAPVVITGDGAAAMAALLRHQVHVDDTLTLRGLWSLWHANRGR